MLSLAIPVVVAEVGWVAMQIVDIAMVGQLGPASIGAVGVGSALFFASAVIGMGLLLGLDTVVAQAFGAGQIPDCRAWLRHGLLLALLLALPLTTAVLLGADHLGAWGFDPTVLDLTSSYLRVVGWSMLPLLLFTALRRYLQAVGIVTPVMAALVSANAINALVNWLLVFGHGGFLHLVSRERPGRPVSRGSISSPCWRSLSGASTRRPSGRDWRRRASGVSSGSDGQQRFRCCWSSVSSARRPCSPDAWSRGSWRPIRFVLNLASLTFMVPLGVSAAGAVRVGHAVGAGDLAGARRAGWAALGIGALFMGAAALTFVTVPRLILGRFTQDVDVIETGVLLLLVAAVFQLFDGLQGVATGVLRGLGDTRTPMLANLAGHWLVGLPVGYTLCFWWGWGVVGLWIGLSIGLILVGIALVPVWHRRVNALTR